MFIKRLYQFVMLVSLVASYLNAQAMPTVKTTGKIIPIQHWQLDNGAHAYFVQTKNIPILDLRVIFHAGSAYDGKQFGLANFTASMLDEGANGLSSDQIAEKFDDVAALYGAGVDRDTVNFSLRTLVASANLKQALTTFTALINHPDFPAKAFKRIQQNTLQAIREQQQIPGAIAGHAFMRALYGEHAYAHNSLGTALSINGLSPKKLQQFYRQYYVGANADLVLVGDVSLQQAQAIAEQVVGHLPTGNKPAALAAPQAAKPVHKHVRFPSVQTHVLLGQLAINYHDPRYFPLMVGNYIVGGNPLLSDLFQNVRVKHGLSYSIGSAFNAYQQIGPFLISLQTTTQQVKQAIAISQQTVEDFIQRGPTAKQLQQAKQSMTGQFVLNLSSNSAIASLVTAIVSHHRPLDYLDTYRQKIKAVTVAQIKQAFAELIHPKNFTVITVGQ